MASDPAAQIHEWVDMMKSARDQLQESTEKATGINDDFDEAEDEVQDKVGKGFLGDVDEFTDTLEEESKQTNTQVEEFSHAIAGAHLTKILDGIHYFDDQEDVSTQALDNFLDWVEQAFANAVENGLNKVEEGTEAADSLMGDLEEKVDTSFDGFGNTMDEIESDLEEFKNQTVETFEKAIEHVAETLTSSMKDVFTMISSSVTDTATDQLSNGFDQLTSTFGDMFSNFSGNIEDTAESLMESGAQIFQEMVEHCTDAVKDALVEAIEDAITSVIEQLVQELVEQVVQMGVGATITGAIAPYVPLLVAAKNVCGVINDLLEVMNLGA